MRKWYQMVCLLVMAGLLLAGCGPKNVGNFSEDVTAKLDFNNLSPEENKMPIVKEPLTLTIATNKTVSVAGKNYTYNEIKAFQEMERRSGIKTDFQVVSDEKINLMFASDELPDILLLNWNKIGGVLKYANDGQIIKLDAYMQSYAPYFTKLLKERPDIYSQLVEADGYVYQFPFIRGEPELRIFQGFQIRQDWLDKLGLEMPKTRDDVYKVLKAFKERDPNGNGIQDEIPYIAEKTFGIDRMFNWWGMDEFYLDGDKVKSGWIQPEFKEYVTWMRKLYDEGLIDPDYAITDNKQFDYKVSNELAGMWYGLSGGTLGRLTTLMKSVNPQFRLAGMPWIAADDGKQYVINGEYVNSVTDGAAAISSQCKNIKEAVKWLDYAYSEEGGLLFNFGIEGESYTMVNGIPTYTDEIVNNSKGLPMNEAISQYAVPMGYPMLQSIHYFDQYMQPIQKEAINVWKQSDSSRTVPLLRYTLEEADIVSRKYSEIRSYHTGVVNKFITGKEPLEGFDEYVNKIKNMGIEDVVKAKQSAYDRYKANLR